MFNSFDRIYYWNKLIQSPYNWMFILKKYKVNWPPTNLMFSFKTQQNTDSVFRYVDHSQDWKKKQKRKKRERSRTVSLPTKDETKKNRCSMVKNKGVRLYMSKYEIRISKSAGIPSFTLSLSYDSSTWSEKPLYRYVQVHENI